jgi:hypothetical protein
MKQRFLLFLLVVPFFFYLLVESQSAADIKEEMRLRNLAPFGTPPSHSPALMEKVIAVLPVLSKTFDQMDRNGVRTCKFTKLKNETNDILLIFSGLTDTFL